MNSITNNITDCSMLRRLLIRSTILTLTCFATACYPSASKVPDVKIQQLRRELPGISEACLEKVRVEGIEAFPDSTDACFKMTNPVHWRGLWRNDFEGSRFCPAPAKECSGDTPGDVVWLTFADKSGMTKPSTMGGLYAIEFIGRRTEVRGFYGHLGSSQYEIVVDRLTSAKPIGG